MGFPTNHADFGPSSVPVEKVYVETIPKISAAEQLPFIRLVDRTLQAEDSNPLADVTESEKRLTVSSISFTV